MNGGQMPDCQQVAPFQGIAIVNMLTYGFHYQQNVKVNKSKVKKDLQIDI